MDDTVLVYTRDELVRVYVSSDEHLQLLVTGRISLSCHHIPLYGCPPLSEHRMPVLLPYILTEAITKFMQPLTHRSLPRVVHRTANYLNLNNTGR